MKEENNLNLLQMISDFSEENIPLICNNDKEAEVLGEIICKLKKITCPLSSQLEALLDTKVADKMLLLNTDEFFQRLKALPRKYSENILRLLYSEIDEIPSFDFLVESVYACDDFSELKQLKSNLPIPAQKNFENIICRSRLYLEMCSFFFPPTEWTDINFKECLNNLLAVTKQMYKSWRTINTSSQDWDLIQEVSSTLFKMTNANSDAELFNLIENQYAPIIRDVDFEEIDINAIDLFSNPERLQMPQGFNAEKMAILCESLKQNGYLDDSVENDNFANLFNPKSNDLIKGMLWLKDAGEFTILMKLLYGTINVDEEIIGKYFYRQNITNKMVKPMKISKNDYTERKEKLEPLKAIIERL